MFANIETNRNDDLKICIVTSLLLILALALVGAAICYVVFGIIFLVKDYKIAEECKGSSLWEYALVTVINGVLALLNQTLRKDLEEHLELYYVLSVLFNTGLGIWGGIELFSKSCDNLEKSELWTFGLVAFISQTFVVVLLVTVLIFKVCCDAPEAENTEMSFDEMLNRMRARNSISRNGLEAENTEMSFDELDNRVRTVRDSTNDFIFLADVPKTDVTIVDKSENVISTDVEVEVLNTNTNEEVSNTNAKEEV